MDAVRKIRIIPKPAVRSVSSGQLGNAYVNAGAQYMRQVSGILKDKVNSLRHNALSEALQCESFTRSFLILLQNMSQMKQDSEFGTKLHTHDKGLEQLVCRTIRFYVSQSTMFL